MRAFSLPVIMYHALNVTERYSLDESAFTRQAAYLSSAGFSTVLPETLDEDARRGRGIMVSFDDGHETDFSVAFPVLARYRFSAVSFITTGFVGRRKGYLTWPQVRELKKAGFSIQSHTHRHPLLNVLGDVELRDELRRSKRMIEDRLGCPVTALALPGGGFSRRVREIAREEGYVRVFTSFPGVNGRNEFTAGVFNRMLIGGAVSPGKFSKIVQGDRATYRRALFAYAAKHFIKKCIGFSTYRSLWRRYYKYRY